MAESVTFNGIGKGITVNGSLKQNYYGADFNPDPFDFPQWEYVGVYQSTSSFNLSGFQPGHEVGCSVVSFTVSGPMDLYADLRRYDGSSRSQDGASGRYWEVGESGSFSEWCVYAYFGVDKDEIWSGYSKYYLHYYTIGGELDFNSPTFSVTNLSIDSTLHKSGYMWVEGAHLCYTDNTGDEIGDYGYGYKHKIAYDSNYATSVGSSYSGHLWLDDSDNLRIYYVDANGIKRRTYMSEVWYGGNVNVGSSNAGYIRVGVWDASEGYGHLCFIAPNGSKRRILNGPPAGYT